MECENRQRGLRLWSKTNLTFGKGFEAQIYFALLKTYLAESRRIPLYVK